MQFPPCSSAQKFLKIETKVLAKGLSSLSSDEFEMLHQMQKEMVQNGDQGLFTKTEEERLEDSERRRLDREVGKRATRNLDCAMCMKARC